MLTCCMYHRKCGSSTACCSRNETGLSPERFVTIADVDELKLLRT